ncbi:MAG: Ldh family oxidoreductase [Planctomycetes bacterium]|nr:Ldh family oxidoreductase [Planctomycetota bacterium]
MTAAIFTAAGATAQEAAIVSKHLVEANLAGHDSHGVLRIPQYLEAIRSGNIKIGAQPEVISETATTAVVDGRRGFGQVAATEAMRLAIRKARASGIAAVTVRNSNHTGRLASYTLMGAGEGLISIIMVNAGGGGQSMAPFGGISRRLATNPISIAVPSGNCHPLVLDIATSVAPEGKIRAHYLQGKSLPPGWIIDAQGRPSNDPKDFYHPPGGALLPLGGGAGYKGFGLGFMIDILAGALSGAGCCRFEASEPRDGFLILALEIERFTPRKTFHQHVSQLVEYVKSCPPAPGFEEVYVPGEWEFNQERRRRIEGIFVDEPTWQAIAKIAAEHGVSVEVKSEAHHPAH